MPRLRSFILSAACACIFLLSHAGRTATAQSGLRESLELLDRNQNGMIDPEEITPLARPYLERIANARRMSLDRPNRVDKLQEAARVYYALQNGVAGTSVRADRERTLKGFGPDREEPVVPEFGLAEVKYRYTEEDLDEAEDSLRRYDRDDDGYLDRREAARGRWTHRDPFAMDLDKDDRLSRLELAQRYARRRMLSGDSGELVQRARRTGNGIKPSIVEDADSRRRRERDEWWRKGGDRFWLTAAIMGRYDKNRNGRLEAEESTDIGIPIGAIDANQDGELSRDELFAYMQELQDQTGGQIDGLPGWFYELDTNRDKQVELTEFAAELTDQRVAEFLALDANQDGLLSAQEVMSSKSMMGGNYENTEAEMLPPRKTIVSEIEIPDTFKIADLNLQLTITHTNVDAIDGYLTGPDGTRIELFTAVGGRDDHFQGTIFDDQAGTPIVKARPPFEGSFQPEGLVKRQPGLGVFNGKSIEGVWQLTIRCSRSDRFGMLHRWALIARPDEDSLLADPELAATIPAVPQENASSSEGGSPPKPSPAAAPVSFAKTAPVSSSGKKFDAGYWTPEKKAEFTAKFRRPSSEEWDKLSDEEKRVKLAERSKAIAEYKRAMSGKEGKSKKEDKMMSKERKR